MDIQKEREAFEEFFYQNCLVQWEKDMSEMLFQKLESGDYEYVRLQSSWLSWQAAKAQAVPEVITIGNELQSWVAVNSFAADDGEGVLPVVDANTIAEKIEELTGASQ